MAVFTIATAIVGAIGLTGFAATLATSIIAGGLSLATAKVLGVFKPPNLQSGKDPGVKIQLPPATDNKIPVMYGRNITGGLIVDAGISNQNDTMTYVIVVSEMTDTGTYTVHKIYRDDQTLNFGVGASAHIVQSVTDTNATASNNVAGKLRVRVYAGGTAAGNQIFPTTNQVAATTMLPTISGSTSYEDLVYMVFQIDYDPEENLTGLGAINLDLENSLSEPSNVILDYLQNDRYGVGLSNTEIDTTSFSALQAYSTALVPYTTSAGAGSTQQRWRIDGMLSTYVPVKNNIDQLCQSCSTFFTYNPKLGKFGVVPNRAATTAEKANAFVFNDDNILSDITITSTELYGLYNEIEAEHPLFAKKDQTDVVFISTPTADRNTNEPNNKLTTRYNLVNDNTRVHNLANIDLRQSRLSTVIEFDADYSAIQSDAGDIIKVTNTDFGYNEKLFRVMRVTEQETESGMLGARLACLEYSDDVYEHSNIQSKAEVGLSGIPSWWNFNYANLNIGNITLVDSGDSPTSNVVDPSTGNVVGNVNTNTGVVPVFPDGFPYYGGPYMTIPLSIDANTFISQFQANVTPGANASTPGAANVFNSQTMTFTAPPNVGYFDPANLPDIAIPLNGFGFNILQNPIIDEVQVSVQGRDELTGAASNIAQTTTIPVNVNNFVSQQSLAILTAGAQVEQEPAANFSVVSGTTFLPITTQTFYLLTGTELGDYSLSAYASLFGTISGAFDVGLRTHSVVSFANLGNIATGTVTSTGTEIENISDFPPRMSDNTIISMDPATYSLPADMKPFGITIRMEGYSDIGTSGPGPRGFANMKYELIRVTKGER